MTGKWDFQVLVFTKNYTPNTPKTYYAAWEVLNAQTETDFVYPVDVGVGATYQDGDQEVASGPFTANLGSTWRIIKESPKDTAELLEGLYTYDKIIRTVKNFSNGSTRGYIATPISNRGASTLCRGSECSLTYSFLTCGDLPLRTYTGHAAIRAI